MLHDPEALGRAAGAADEASAPIEPPPADDPAPAPEAGLWPRDTGTLRADSRRALLAVLKGPYLSGATRPQLWSALLADEAAIRSRLHDLFLDLVVDRIDEFAFARKVKAPDLDIPSAVRTEPLAFIDTAMLLVLRQLLLAAQGEGRVIVGQDEVYDRLAVYRGDADEGGFLRNLNAAWGRMMNRVRVIHSAGDDRVEISPVVKFLVDEDRVRALTEEYRRIGEGDDGDAGRAREADAGPAADADASGPAEPNGDES